MQRGLRISRFPNLLEPSLHNPVTLLDILEMERKEKETRFYIPIRNGRHYGVLTNETPLETPWLVTSVSSVRLRTTDKYFNRLHIRLLSGGCDGVVRSEFPIQSQQEEADA